MLKGFHMPDVRRIASPVRSLACMTLCCLLLAACGGWTEDEEDLLVFAAASLQDALEAIEEEVDSEVGIAVSYGGSHMLARQLSAGAPADVFISAGAQPTQTLVDEGLVDGDPVDVVTNRLVVVTIKGGADISAMDELTAPGVGRVAIADPDLAPAGEYAREALVRLGLWERVEDKLILGSDVRATLAYVQTGNVDAAIVYESDAAGARGVVVYDVVPADSYTPVVYPAVVVVASDKAARAIEFVEMLRGGEAGAIFERFGFARP